MRPVTTAPMPASTAMPAPQAAWYIEHTHGQLQAAPVGNTGLYYLYDTRPAPATGPRGATPPSAP